VHRRKRTEESRPRFRFPRWLLIVLAASALLQWYLAARPGLWVDEVFSVALATGHSLEHPLRDANAALGDYVQTGDALHPSAWRRYMEHDSPPASPRRVMRAVFLSDTNPPLYYLLLSAWTRAVGTTDFAIRMFSVLVTLACFPLLWRVGLAILGREAAVFACLLFAFAPTVLAYSGEARMYSLTWFFGLALALSTLELHRAGTRPLVIGAWVVTGGAALLTHYFLVFVWCACAAWLMIVPGKTSRRTVVIAVALSFAIISPLYLQIPESMNRWRVTAGWLDTPLRTRDILVAPLQQVWSMLAPARYWASDDPRNWLVLTGISVAFAAALRRGGSAFVSPRTLLPLMWLGAVLLGLLAFDLVRGSHASLFPRYVLPSLPALFLITGFALSRSPARGVTVALVLTAVGWAWGIYGMRGPAHPWQPFPEIAARIDERARPGDVLIVRSIPSGVLGIARYMKSDTPVYSWVEQTGGHRETDVERLLEEFCRVVLLSIHPVTDVNTVEPWLRARGILISQENVRQIGLQYFRSEKAEQSVKCRSVPRAAHMSRSGPVHARGPD